MTVVAAIGSWAGDRHWQQIAVMAFLGTRGDCCMIIAVAEGVVELSAQVSIGDVVVLAIIYSYVLVAVAVAIMDMNMSALSAFSV